MCCASVFRPLELVTVADCGRQACTHLRRHTLRLSATECASTACTCCCQHDNTACNGSVASSGLARQHHYYVAWVYQNVQPH